MIDAAEDRWLDKAVSRGGVAEWMWEFKVLQVERILKKKWSFREKIFIVLVMNGSFFVVSHDFPWIHC